MLLDNQDELGFIQVVTPEAIKQFRNSVSRGVLALNNDFRRNAANIDAHILEAWRAWFTDFNEYMQDSSFWGDLWESSLDTAENWARELEEWRQIYNQFSSKPATGPSIPRPQQQPGQAVFSNVLDVIKWVSLPLGIFLIWEITRKIK